MLKFSKLNQLSIFECLNRNIRYKFIYRVFFKRKLIQKRPKFVVLLMVVNQWNLSLYLKHGSIQTLRKVLEKRIEKDTLVIIKY